MFYEFKPVQSSTPTERGVCEVLRKTPSLFKQKMMRHFASHSGLLAVTQHEHALPPRTEPFQPLCWGPWSHEGLASAASFQRQQRLTDKAMQMDGNAQEERHLPHSLGTPATCSATAPGPPGSTLQSLSLFLRCSSSIPGDEFAWKPARCRSRVRRGTSTLPLIC